MGVTVVAGRSFSTSNFKPLIKFRTAVNTILGTFNSPSEPILIKLLCSVCVPNLTYACETISYTSQLFEPLTVALNDSICRIFTYNRWESVRYLRLDFGYPSLCEILAQRSRQFIERIPLLRNSTLSSLAAL